MLFDLDLGEITLRLINIYAPNVDNPPFLKKNADNIEPLPETYTLICRDLNPVLDPKMASQNYVTINYPKARAVLLETMLEHNLTDIFRQLHPKIK